MHGQINSNDHFKIIKTYFAYRGPNETSVSCYSGDLIEVKSLTDTKDDDIILSTFEGIIYCLRNKLNCELSVIHLYPGKTLPKNTSREAYNTSYLHAIGELRNKTCEKVVLSRIKKIDKTCELADTFNALNIEYPTTFNYLFSSPNLGTWMGASPELLCTIKNNLLRTVALAGTKTEEEDWTKKEIIEQQYVTDFISSTLSDFSNKVHVSEPYDQNAGPVVHLKTDISAELNSTNWYELVSALHPTPAICGTPTLVASTIIDKSEKHERQLYTGFIGLNSKDKRVFFVNLRCMQITKDATYLYLGGGLTIDSDLEREWNETERKAKTLESVISK